MTKLVTHLCLGFVTLAACGDDPATGESDTTVTSSDTTPDVPDQVDEVHVDPALFCQGTTHFVWDPSGATLGAFPDDLYTRDDPASLTGLRVSLGEPAWLAAEAAQVQPLWRQADELDGFGTSAAVTLRADGPLGDLPTGSVDSVASETIRFYDLGDAEPTRVAFETEVFEGGRAANLWPMRPLREKTLHAVVILKDHTAADGHCLAPSDALRSLLAADSDDPKVKRLYDRAATFFARTGIAREDISALTLFTTQAITEVTLAERADIRARAYDWKTVPTCTTGSKTKACKGTFDAYDYRNEGYLGDAHAPSSYTLPVRVWLPKTHTGPVPVVVFGHGLGGDANDGASIASFLVDLGIATVALPAPRHGDHPTARHDDPNAFFLDLLGIDLQAFTIDGFVFRENVRQACFDKLQMMQLLAAHSDVDGDGQPDLDMDHVAYWGISLGGIMGSDFSAQSDRIGASILSIPGARVLSILTDAAQFGSFKSILESVATEDGVIRLAPLGQALVDAGDPVNWAPHVVDQRIDERAPPDVLVQMVIDDEVVPNIATRSLVRALADIPQVPPIIRSIDLLSSSSAPPLAANLDGDVTVGLFQFDRVSDEPGGTPVKAEHGNVFSGIEALEQVHHFLATWLTGSPEIIDPYTTFGTPALTR